MKRTILIVDDDEIMLLLLKRLFEKIYNIVTACDGVEALSYLSREIPDIIISDLIMENINGYEFIKHLSSSSIFNAIPVIVVSNIPETEILSVLPAVKIINKPFDPVILSKCIDVIVSRLNAELLCTN